MAVFSIDPSIDKLVHDESSIFNYLTSEVLLDKVLGENRLRFKKLTLTNDPYEYTHITAYSAPYGHDDNQAGNPFYMETVRCIADLRYKMCIGCFCRNEDQSESFFHPESGEVYYAQSGYQHSRMWSQYGEDHKGACIVLDKYSLINELQGKFKHELFFADEIRYKQGQLFLPESEDLDSFRHLKPDQAAIQYFLEDKHRMKLLFTKDIDYEREKEFRIAFYSEHDYEYASLNALKAIILGHRFPKDKVSEVDEIGRSLGIAVLKINYFGNTAHLIQVHRS